jgi:carbonic anhydrase
MKYARKPPAYLVSRFRGWRATTYAENKSWFRHLVREGQHPRTMLIGCCDSRVHMTEIFEADPGEFFIHRNIANLVPPFSAQMDHRGTPAAVEFAIKSLHVAHLIVVGHSKCGGVRGCHDLYAGEAPQAACEASFVARWLEILKPGYDRTAGHTDPEDRIQAMEREAVRISLENLLTFDFVRDAVEQDQLTLHGVWHDIAEGTMEYYDGQTDRFVPVV